MAVKFEMQYDSIHTQLKVLQNGKQASSYSQFSRCNNQPFETWFDKLPQYCIIEANAEYSVIFTGGPVFTEIFRKIFSMDYMCKSFHIKSELITGFHRIRWANDLATLSSVSLPVVSVFINASTNSFNILDNSFSTKSLCNKGEYWIFADLQKLPIHLFFTNKLDANTSITIVSTYKEYEELSNKQVTENSQAVIIINGNKFEFIEAHNNHFLFYCGQNSLLDFIRFWIHDFILPSYLISVFKKMSEICKWSGVDYEIANIKRNMLIQDEPYLELDVPSRIELNDIAHFRLKKFPEDISCIIRTNNPDIAMLGENFTIKPLQEGVVSIVVQVKEHQEFSVSQKINIYKYYEVQKIQMSVLNNPIMEGEQFQIKSAFYPTGAQNIQQASWSIFPQNCIQMLSPGVFMVKQAGVYTITQTVGSVSESITVTVHPRPTGIDFDLHILSIKLGDYNKHINLTIFPSSCKGGKVRYHVSDPNILDYDSNNGFIHPKSEGEAVITATLLDESNCILDESSCKIIITPPKEIITPDGVSVILIISIIGMLFLFATPFKYVFGVSSIMGLIWFAIRKRNTKVYLICTVIALLLIVLLIWGGAYS